MKLIFKIQKILKKFLTFYKRYVSWIIKLFKRLLTFSSRGFKWLQKTKLDRAILLFYVFSNYSYYLCSTLSLFRKLSIVAKLNMNNCNKDNLNMNHRFRSKNLLQLAFCLTHSINNIYLSISIDKRSQVMHFINLELNSTVDSFCNGLCNFDKIYKIWVSSLFALSNLVI